MSVWARRERTRDHRHHRYHWRNRRSRCCPAASGARRRSARSAALPQRAHGLDTAPSRFGQLPNFDYQPALGAGTTGFDSTNAQEAQGEARPRTSAQPRRPRAARPIPARSAAPTPNAVTAPAGIHRHPGVDAEAAAAGGGAARRAASTIRRVPARRRATLDAAIATIATTPPSRRPPPEEKPFDPLGVQLGAFIFRPAMEYTRGFDNNPARNSAPPAQSSWFNIYSPELLINSNWAVHEFTASLRGSYTTFDTMHQLDRPTVDAKATSRIDVTSQTRIELEGRYLLFTDNPGSPNIQAGLCPSADRPYLWRHRRRRAPLQPVRRLAQGQLRPHGLQRLRVRRRADRQQRRPQLQPLRPRAAHQLRGHPGREAVRRARRRPQAVRSRGRRRRRGAHVARQLRQGRHDAGAAAQADRRDRASAISRAATSIRRWRTSAATPSMPRSPGSRPRSPP